MPENWLKNQYGPVSFSAGNTTEYLLKALKINDSLLQHALQIIWGQKLWFFPFNHKKVIAVQI